MIRSASRRMSVTIGSTCSLFTKRDPRPSAVRLRTLRSLGAFVCAVHRVNFDPTLSPRHVSFIQSHLPSPVSVRLSLSTHVPAVSICLFSSRHVCFIQSLLSRPNSASYHPSFFRLAGAAVANAKSIHEKAIPHKPVAMDLVIWGHEHECQIGGGMDSVEEKADYSFVVLQVIV